MAKKGPAHGLVSVLIEGNDRQVRYALERLEIKLAPAAIGAWMMGTVDPYIKERAQERFTREGDDVTGAWAPLREATWGFRQRHQPPYPPQHPINKRTGELEAYITRSQSDLNVHTLGATLKTPGRLPTGELKKKVERAQFGDPLTNTVRRPVMGVNERDLLAVLTDLSLYISVGMFK